MISLRRKKSILAAVAVTSFALVASAVPANAEVGVSSTEIKLGTTVPMTGIAAPGYSKVAPAMKAYFEYINDNGGVYGRKINLVIKDDRYIPQEAINKTNELILKDKVFALVGQLGTANHLAVTSKVRIASRNIPSLFLNTGYSGFADVKKFKTSFMHFPTYVAEAKILSSYIKENFTGKKTCLLVQNDEFGADAEKGFATAGLTFDETVKYVSGTQSATTAQTWITRFAGAKCEVVVLFSVSSATAAALGVASAAGYKPQWILGSVGADSTTLKIALNNPQAQALLNGAIGVSFMPDALDTTDEYVKLFRAAMLTVQALRAAGQNPTRRSLIAAMESKGSTFASAAYGNLAVSRTSRAGFTGYWFGKFNLAGALIPLDAGRTVYTTDSATGPVTKASAKRAALPAKGIPTNS
ncbi:MAG: hypothetical protein EBX26_00440 [Actinobacteria bacterium]|nr:hypothetical protein [Actinomycetota bacterium]